MRPHFAIYLAAGVTLLLAVVSMIGGFGQALAMLQFIKNLRPTGHDLETFNAMVTEFCWEGMGGLLLAVLQGGILFYARKLHKLARAA
ncbi:MAG: hypothetical protein HZA90_27085 [Verrucomicrobia bacterium]|nr:hypothetical protein [Verrucomicrobiota bacterium]